jgi:hypothetical protein
MEIKFISYPESIITKIAMKQEIYSGKVKEGRTNNDKRA